jgi:catechol 2,3-dioxygenase-like lactoylglutathione lyase family enzyme
MSVELDHTIVLTNDKQASAGFLADVLGVAPPVPAEPFVAVTVANGVTLDFMDVADEVTAQHYAFAVSDTEFDEIFGRLRARGQTYWADPFKSRPGEVRTIDGARGVYFEDPSGHLLEILTR